MTTKFFISGDEPDRFKAQLFARVGKQLSHYDRSDNFQTVIFCMEKELPDIILIKPTGIGLIKFYDEAGEISLTTQNGSGGSNRKTKEMIEGRQKFIFLGVLEKHFDLAELQGLCDNLNIDHENITGKGKAQMYREFFGYIQRRDRIEELIVEVKRLRPTADFADFSTLPWVGDKPSRLTPWIVEHHDGFYRAKEISSDGLPPHAQLQTARNIVGKRIKQLRNRECVMPDWLESPSLYQTTACFTQNYGLIALSDDIKYFANEYQIPRFQLTTVENLSQWALQTITSGIKGAHITKRVADHMVSEVFAARSWIPFENDDLAYGFMYHMGQEKVIQRIELFHPIECIGRGTVRTGRPDYTISSRHVKILNKPDGSMYLEDMGSKNGTKIYRRNSRDTIRLVPHREIPLYDGDEFTMSNVITMKVYRHKLIPLETIAISQDA